MGKLSVFKMDLMKQFGLNLWGCIVVHGSSSQPEYSSSICQIYEESDHDFSENDFSGETSATQLLCYNTGEQVLHSTRCGPP